MIDPHRPSYPLPPFTAEQVASEAQNPGARAWRERETPDEPADMQPTSAPLGEAGVVGAPPHSAWTLGMMNDEKWSHYAATMQQRAAERSLAIAEQLNELYRENRRARAEAIGRPYPDARHAVWPR